MRTLASRGRPGRGFLPARRSRRCESRLKGQSQLGKPSLHAAGARKWPRGTTLAATLVARELSLTCHGKHGTQALAVDDVGLSNLTQSDLEAPVRIIKYCDMLSSDWIGLGSRRDEINDLVVLNRELVRDGAGLLPGKHVVQPRALGFEEFAMRVMIGGGRAPKAGVVERHG